MSMYNLMFGTNRAAGVLLSMLGLRVRDVPRFRDCWLEKDTIVLLTRTGGGNREAYEYPDADNEGICNENLRKLPEYLRDEDWEMDSTYARFYFNFPDKYKPYLDRIAEGEDLTIRWNKMLEALKDLNSPEGKRVRDALKPLLDELASHRVVQKNGGSRSH